MAHLDMKAFFCNLEKREDVKISVKNEVKIIVCKDLAFATEVMQIINQSSDYTILKHYATGTFENFAYVVEFKSWTC